MYFDVVLDVDSYHEFVPFCSASKVTRVLGPSQIEADLTIGFRIFTEAYTSHIDFDRPRSIRIRSIESSVFGHLISTWSFRPNPKDAKQCYVEFDIDFEVNSPVHASAVKLFFTDVAERQIKAFSDRCIKLYKEGRIKAEIEPEVVTAAKVTPKPAVAAPLPTPPVAALAAPTVAAAPAAPAVQPIAPAVARKTATGLPVPSTAFRYPQRPVPGDVPAVSPDVLVSTSGSALLACPVPHLGPRIKFSASEIEKLRLVFMKHAKPVPLSAAQLQQQQREAEQASAVSKIASTAADHLYASAGPSAELRLDVAGFAALCTDVCMSTGGVFGRFRERATVRTISDVGANGVLTHALFVGDPHLYASSNNLCPGAFSDAAGSAAVPEIEDPEALVSARRLAADGSSSPLSLVPHSYSFGDFLSHFYYITKATIEEKLLYALVICARRAATQGGQEGYDPSRNREGSPIPSDLFNAASATAALSIPSLRSATAAFFCAHVGVLRHIMPLMSYHRARELRDQIDAHRRSIAQRQADQAASPNAALLPPITSEVSAPVEPGVTVLALLGLLEGVLSEAEAAVSEAIEQMSEQVEQAQEEEHVWRTKQQPSSVAASAPLSSRLVPLEHWVSLWSNQAELLALVSVPGLATLIQINSIVPLEAHQPTKKQA